LLSNGGVRVIIYGMGITVIFWVCVGITVNLWVCIIVIIIFNIVFINVIISVF
jgi:hypothetical protein